MLLIEITLGYEAAMRKLKKQTYLNSPNYRGKRYIFRNPCGSNASLVRRYNAMLQILHREKTGNPSAMLTDRQLLSKRRLLRKQAREVLALIEKERPDVKYWSELGRVDQQYYAMVLEEQAAEKCRIEIFSCENQWCAKHLLEEAFKGHRQNIGRRAKEGSSGIEREAEIIHEVCSLITMDND